MVLREAKVEADFVAFVVKDKVSSLKRRLSLRGRGKNKKGNDYLAFLIFLLAIICSVCICLYFALAFLVELYNRHFAHFCPPPKLAPYPTMPRVNLVDPQCFFWVKGKIHFLAAIII